MINFWIVKKYRDVRLIGSDGSQVGIINTKRALQMAEGEQLDLVMVSESATPPVCKIADYGKMKYEENKTKKANKKHVQETKGLKISPRIAEHDLGVNIKKAKEFLEGGDKVRVVCQFKAREITHPELGAKHLQSMFDALQEVCNMEMTPKLEGKQMVMVLGPARK